VYRIRGTEFALERLGNPRGGEFPPKTCIWETVMDALLSTLPIAAADYSLVYLLGGGGIGGAIVVYLVAKMMGR
jgi:hypothetical protein